MFHCPDCLLEKLHRSTRRMMWLVIANLVDGQLFKSNCILDRAMVLDVVIWILRYSSCAAHLLLV